VGLAVQPEILRDIAGMPGFRGLGLLARILFSVPENTVGRRKIGADPIPTQVAADYHANLHALVLALAEWTDPAVLVLEPEANNLVLETERQVEPRLAPGGAWAHIVDWGSKYTGAVVRIAGLIHLAEHLHDGWAKPIDADTVRRAAQIGEYYAAHALGAFDDMGADVATHNARHLLAWIERTATTAFTKREAFRAVQSAQFKTMADLDPALAVLEAHGYLRQLDPPALKRAGGRPPSPSYLVNPEVHRPAATVHPLTIRRASRRPDS
jgi:hypothetical protein